MLLKKKIDEMNARTRRFNTAFAWMTAIIFALIFAANIAAVWVIIHFVEKYW